MNSKTLNLDQIVNRAEVPTLKFDGETMRRIFGATDLWPSWVVDMDFRAALEIREALPKRLAHGVYGYEATSKNLSNAVAAFISPVKSFNLSGVANSMIVIEDEDKRQGCKEWCNRMEISKNHVFTNVAMLAAYTKGEAWLDQVTDYLRGNLQVLRTFLQHKTPIIKLIEPEGGFIAWLDFRALSFYVKQLESCLVNEAKMATNPGHWFGREGAGFARIINACPRSILESTLLQPGQAYLNSLKKSGNKNGA